MSSFIDFSFTVYFYARTNESFVLKGNFKPFNSDAQSHNRLIGDEREFGRKNHKDDYTQLDFSIEINLSCVFTSFCLHPPNDEIP